MNRVSYFTWIANLGVVPLLRAILLRTFPAFLFLRQRFLSVILLRETISKLLLKLRFKSKLKQQIYCSNLLTCFFDAVKIILIFILIIGPHQYLYAAEKTEDIFLSPGEHREILVTDLKSFTISSSNVVSHKLSRAKTFLIKAKKQGLSELVIWKKDGTKETYRIHVKEKNEKQSEVLSLAQNLELLGLKVQMQGSFVGIQGTVSDLNTYGLLKRMKDTGSEFLNFDIELSLNLRNYILGDIYYVFFNEYIDFINCKNDNLEFICYYPGPELENPASVQKLKSKYDLNLIAIKAKDRKKNYRAHLKILQLEESQGRNYSLGLNKLNIKLNEFFTQGLDTIAKENELYLEEHNLKLSTLAEPIIDLRTDQKATFNLGEDIPYVMRNDQGQRTIVWKFAGLFLELTLKQNGPYLQLEYMTEISSPTSSNENSSISLNKGTSLINIKMNEATKLFQVTLKTKMRNRENLPWFAKIPLLGILFRGVMNADVYKEITGLIYLEEKDL